MTAQEQALWRAIKRIERRLTTTVGVPPNVHATNHSNGSTDPIDITDLDGYPSGSPALLFLREDGAWATPPGGIVGPGSPSVQNAIVRFADDDPSTLEATLASIDDFGIITATGVHLPLYDAGNSGTSKTLDWNNSNEQLLTLTGNVTLTLNNPRDGGRYVLLLDQDGAGGHSVTWPASVIWPGNSAPTITTDADHGDLVTLIYRAGRGKYQASINQDYTF